MPTSSTQRYQSRDGCPLPDSDVKTNCYGLQDFYNALCHVHHRRMLARLPASPAAKLGECETISRIWTIINRA